MNFKYIYIVFFLVFLNSFGQQEDFNGDPDKAFEVARELAFNGNREHAQVILKNILTKYPDYNDIRAFLASTYSWDGNYKLAQIEFAQVLKNDPKRLDTWEAAIKNELYSEAPFNALKMANKALEYFPKNPDILYLKATAEDKSNNKEDALFTLENVLKENPEHEKALLYKESIMNDLRQNSIGLRSSVDIYSEVYSPMQYYLVSYGKHTKRGSILAKLNVSNRFVSTGAQFEVDLYPRITKGLYAYANFGLSNSFLYPNIRYGAELYKSLPKNFEASIGFRALKYNTTTTIYTGSMDWYTGNDYLLFRAYVTPGNSKTSTSGMLTYRKYKQDANNYVGVDVSVGFSPEVYRFEFEGNENAIVNLKSQKLNLGYYFTSKNNKHAWGLQSGISHQEKSFEQGSYFWIYSLALSWDLKFK